jgi:hypothetical protein
VTTAIGVKDDDLWRRIVDQDGKQGAGFYRQSYIVTEEPGRD